MGFKNKMIIKFVDENGNNADELIIDLNNFEKNKRMDFYDDSINDIKTGNISSSFSKKISMVKKDKLKCLWTLASEYNVRNTVFSNSFRTDWSTRSDEIRKEFNDDLILKKILWNVLPPYTGGNLTLWRGEKTSVFKKNIIGFNWSTNKEYVEASFANGLYCDRRGGGSLLEIQIESEGIISGHGNHRLDDPNLESSIVVDPCYIKKINLLNSFKRNR